MKNLLIFFLLSLGLYAHETSQALLSMKVDENNVTGWYKFSISDGQILVDMDSNKDTKITFGEIQAHRDALAQAFMDNVQIQSLTRSCPLTIQKDIELYKLRGNTYIHLGFDAQCPEEIRTLNLGYTLFFDHDLKHKALAKIKYGEMTHNVIVTHENLNPSIKLKESNMWETFVEFVKQGIIHIFIGIDHILFLVALLLPSVLILRQRRWFPNDSLKTTLINVLKVVTAFTVAHSITLTLTVLGVITLPSWIVESFIAFSVILAALNNITGTIEKRLWVLVFFFGLVHGMGFASVLIDLGLDKSALALSLFGFNIGVELGQIAIVALLVPLLYLTRAQKWYVPLVLYVGSAITMLIGSLWFFERVSEGLGF